MIELKIEEAVVILGTYADVEFWIEKEIEEWSWLANADDGESFQIQMGRLTELRAHSGALESQGQSLEQVGGYMLEQFRPSRSDRAFYSRGQVGQSIIRVSKLRGASAGAFAHGFASGRYKLINASNIDMVGALMTLAMPDMGKPDELAKRLQAERQNDRNATTRALAAIERDSIERRQEWESAKAQLRLRYQSWATRGLKRLVAVERRRASDAASAVDAIKATDTLTKKL